MAERDYLSSVKIGTNEYDLYATSALSAGWVPATAVEGDIPIEKITGVYESAISSVNLTAVTAVTSTAITGDIPWSSISSNAQPSSTSSTSGFWTPSSTIDYVTSAINDKISNVYKFKGTCQVENLPTSNNQNGDVWNLSNGGIINSSDASHSATVYTSDNVAWITADGGYWDKLASTDTSAKLDTTAFTTWSANPASEFSGSAASATTAWVTMNVSGNDGTQGGDTASADGYSLIQSALSGASAWETITVWSAEGKPISTTGGYLVGDGTNSAKLALVEPENSITGTTPASALVNAQGISSFVDTNYIAKTDITVDTTEHQLVINNT